MGPVHTGHTSADSYIDFDPFEGTAIGLHRRYWKHQGEVTLTSTRLRVLQCTAQASYYVLALLVTLTSTRLRVLQSGSFVMTVVGSGYIDFDPFEGTAIVSANHEYAMNAHRYIDFDPFEGTAMASWGEAGRLVV